MKRVLKDKIKILIPNKVVLGFPMKRVLKVDENKRMIRQLQIVSHEKGVESGEEGPGTNAVPHVKGVESCISTAHPPPDFGHGFP